MNKELINKVKEELVYIGVLFLAGVIIFKIAFYKDVFFVVLKTVFAFFWIFLVPGFFMMYLWHEKLGFTERFIAGIALSAALMGMGSYFLGLFGLHIKYHGFILPLFYLIAGLVLLFRK